MTNEDNYYIEKGILGDSKKFLVNSAIVAGLTLAGFGLYSELTNNSLNISNSHNNIRTYNTTTINNYYQKSNLKKVQETAELALELNQAQVPQILSLESRIEDLEEKNQLNKQASKNQKVPVIASKSGKRPKYIKSQVKKIKPEIYTFLTSKESDGACLTVPDKYREFKLYPQNQTKGSLDLKIRSEMPGVTFGDFLINSYNKTLCLNNNYETLDKLDIYSSTTPGGTENIKVDNLYTNNLETLVNVLNQNNLKGDGSSGFYSIKGKDSYNHTLKYIGSAHLSIDRNGDSSWMLLDDKLDGTYLMGNTPKSDTLQFELIKQNPILEKSHNPEYTISQY